MAFYKTGSSVAPVKQVNMKDWNNSRTAPAQAAGAKPDDEEKKKGK